jgi:hypothetical protein
MNEENKVLTPWQKYKQNLGQTRPWDLINPKTEWVDKIISDERLSICKSCPELIELTNQCKKCGCFMNAKTRLQIAACPIGKW